MGKANSKLKVPLRLYKGCHAKSCLRFDTSVGRGDTVTVIGIGRVIKGVYSCSLLIPCHCAQISAQLATLTNPHLPTRLGQGHYGRLQT